MAIESAFSVEMIERVMREWEEEHPGQRAVEMSPEEFADRMMTEIKASARVEPL